MSDIRPIDLPTAAGVEYGRGDVRHFSETDAVGVPGLQNPTRHLAERDNLIAAKVNELVSTVNNKEQFVPLPVPRTVLAPGTEEIVTNFKIPDGFEARILNAAVGSNPVSNNASLKIYYSSGYGNMTGVELVSTTSTFNSGVAFYNGGEFIVALRNAGASTLEAVASLTLTIRPLGSTASLLVGSVVRGERGYRGEKGDKGLKGDPGVGGAGSPGLVWSGVFDANNSYAPPQAVSYTVSGVTQSYVCKLSNPGPGAQPPTNAAYWDVLAGATAVLGAQFRWKGIWSDATAYVNDSTYIDIVSQTSGSVTSAYLCTTSNINKDPSVETAYWDVFASPGGETPAYDVNILTGAGGYNPAAPYIAYGGTYAPGVANDSYGTVTPINSRTASLSFTEYKIVNSVTTPQGMAMLNYKFRSCFKGDIYVRLPGTASGAAIDWDTDDVHCIVTQESGGTAAYNTSAGTEAIRVISLGTTFPAGYDRNLFKIDVSATTPRNVSVSFIGMAAII